MTEILITIAVILFIAFMGLSQSDGIKQLCKHLSEKGKAKKSKHDALYDGVRSLLKAELYRIYIDGRNHNNCLSATEFDIATSCFAEYTALGGNHTMPEIYGKIKTMEIKEDL